MPKYKQYSPILASNFEQEGQENMTSYNLPYWPCYHGHNVRVNKIKLDYSAAYLHHNLIELGHFFAAIALLLLSYFAKYPVLSRIWITTLLKYKVN